LDCKDNDCSFCHPERRERMCQALLL